MYCENEGQRFQRHTKNNYILLILIFFFIMGQPWLQLKLVKLILHYYTEKSCELEGIYMLVSVRFNIEHLTLWIETSDRKRDNYFPLCLHCWSMLPTNHVTLKVIFLNIGPVSKQNLTINMIFVMILCVPNYDRYTLNRTSKGSPWQKE